MITHRTVLRPEHAQFQSVTDKRLSNAAPSPHISQAHVGNRPACHGPPPRDIYAGDFRHRAHAELMAFIGLGAKSYTRW
jgi:hypothetical protein